MRKYILSRIFRSLLSVVVVTALVYVIVYTLVPTSLIFKQDPNYNKMTKTLDKKVDYENTTFDSMGYIDYLSAGELQKRVSSQGGDINSEAAYQNYLSTLNGQWQLKTYPLSEQFYATRDIPIYERVWSFSLI